MSSTLNGVQNSGSKSFHLMNPKVRPEHWIKSLQSFWSSSEKCTNNQSEQKYELYIKMTKYGQNQEQNLEAPPEDIPWSSNRWAAGLLFRLLRFFCIPSSLFLPSSFSSAFCSIRSSSLSSGVSSVLSSSLLFWISSGSL